MTGSIGPDLRTRHYQKVTASLSHELGNVLATMQESAGLMDDYVAGAADGELIEVEHLKPILVRMERNVARGLEFVGLLNWLAHGTDDGRGAPVLSEALDKALSSARYFARQRNVELSATSGEAAVSPALCSLDLHILLFHCFLFAADRAAAGAGVHCAPSGGGEGPTLCFTVSESRQDRPPEGRPVEELVAEVESCGGSLSWRTGDVAALCLVLRLP